jgi:medium-chain acyl-[acyl-carrier-protein] hydrolase
MGEDIEVTALQLPGRETRFDEQRETDITQLVNRIVDALQGYLDKPFAMFGYSLGALLAFEVTRELRRRGLAMPVHLFIAAMRAPQTPRVHPPLAGLDDESFIQQIEHYYSPQNEAWNIAELREMILPVLKDDIALAEGYNYTDETPISPPIDAYAGDQDLGAPPELVQRWSEQTTGKMTYHRFPGSHFFIDSALAEIQKSVFKSLQSYRQLN